MPTPVNTLVLMAKAPEPGKVKTRLVPPLTPAEAAEFYHCLLVDQLDHLASFGGADLYLAYAPDDAAGFFQRLVPRRMSCFPQRGGDIGERMNHCFVEMTARGYRNVVVIGSDLPPLPLPFLETAFGMLQEGQRSVVLGPSRDGGYYLIGMNRSWPQVFADIPWSSSQVLACTVARLNGLGAPPALLPRWMDIDSFEDLLEWKSAAVDRLSARATNVSALLDRWSVRAQPGQSRAGRSK